MSKIGYSQWSLLMWPCFRLRDDDYSPYLGFIDCAKKIINEEGLGTLYRCWVLSAFPAFTGFRFLTAHKALPQHF